MIRQEFDSKLELWMGEKSAELGDLHSYLEGAKDGVLLGRFSVWGAHQELYVAVIGYNTAKVPYGNYAVLRSSKDPHNQAIQVEVFGEQEYSARALVLGSLVLEPPESARFSRLGHEPLVLEK